MDVSPYLRMKPRIVFRDGRWLVLRATVGWPLGDDRSAMQFATWLNGWPR